MQTGQRFIVDLALDTKCGCPKRLFAQRFQHLWKSRGGAQWIWVGEKRRLNRRRLSQGAAANKDPGTPPVPSI
jgi:hypothetical protein